MISDCSVFFVTQVYVINSRHLRLKKNVDVSSRECEDNQKDVLLFVLNVFYSNEISKYVFINDEFVFSLFTCFDLKWLESTDEQNDCLFEKKD